MTNHEKGEIAFRLPFAIASHTYYGSLNRRYITIYEENPLREISLISSVGTQSFIVTDIWPFSGLRLVIVTS
jgi:hypothetical protein